MQGRVKRNPWVVSPSVARRGDHEAVWKGGFAGRGGVVTGVSFSGFRGASFVARTFRFDSNRRPNSGNRCGTLVCNIASRCASPSSPRSAPPPSSAKQMGKGAAFPYRRWVGGGFLIRLGNGKGLWRSHFWLAVGESWEVGRGKLRLLPNWWVIATRGCGALVCGPSGRELPSAGSAPPPTSPEQMGKGAAFPYRRWVGARVLDQIGERQRPLTLMLQVTSGRRLGGWGAN
jgi:hypothetical protein